MAKHKALFQVPVSSSSSEYLIHIGYHVLLDSKFWSALIASDQVFIVTNQTIAPLYLHFLQHAFVDKQCDVFIMADGEEYKNQHHLFELYEALIQKNHHRDTTLIALGGGVVGDITGFAAATYQRGVPYIQVPTTLLAQVDASVGGKTAINHALGKNSIGSFYQPKAVVMDMTTLNTLPPREFRSGLAEVIKYGLLEGGSFLQRLISLLEQGLTCSNPELPDLIGECCRIKARFVALDERDYGDRALLNLGHTVAHALESYTHYKQWLHGEAVSIGLYCAAVLSNELGLIHSSVVELVEQVLKCAGLPYKIPKSVDLMKLMHLMNWDKKIKNGCLRFVVLRGPGDCYLRDNIAEHDVHSALVASVEGE